MSISQHLSNIKLSTDQQVAIDKLEQFLHSTTQVFILKGYAGSGKTTLLRGLIRHLGDIQRPFSVMAPTGRAAKILREKTGFGHTIHSSIYDFKNLKSLNSESKELADHSFLYTFPIASNDAYEHVIIVDESSMISSRLSRNELFSFGTDVLLNDLLTYARLSVSKNKIIFVGDPAQLPPVGDNQSCALDETFFRHLGLTLDSTEMTQVVRQKDNLILKNASAIREVYKTSIRNTLNFEYDNTTFCKINPENIVAKYLDLNPAPEIGSGVIIAFSNAQCLSYNQSIRKLLFPDNVDIVEGDLLCICNNNYHTYAGEIFNGDMAKVVAVSKITEKQSAPVWVDKAGKKYQKNVHFVFRDISLVLDSGIIIECKILDSLLNSDLRDLTIEEMKGLYINFVMRFQDLQKERARRNEIPYKVGSEEFRQLLRADPYLNAVRVKYGYAITCHKAQGGEWDTTFVDYYGRVGLKDDQLRWSYTATTRAVNRSFVLNPPMFSTFAGLKISELIKVANLPANGLQLKNVPVSPFHKESQHRCKSLRYWEIADKLEQTPYQISKIVSVGEFQERYFFAIGTSELICETYHNMAGIFKDFKALSTVGQETELLELINNVTPYIFNIEYNPGSKELEMLFSKIQAACEEIGIVITNIEEQIGQYYVNYYFRTTGRFSYIQFYFDGSKKFTFASPRSDIGLNDLKLLSLIEKLK